MGGNDAVQALIPCLQSPHTQVRAESARALGILGAAETTAFISKLLQDKEWEVRREAAGALGKLGNPESIEPLAKVLDDTDGDVSGSCGHCDVEDARSPRYQPAGARLKDELASVRRIAAGGLSRLDPD